MARLRADYVFGTTTAALAATDTTLSGAALARLPVVAGGDTAAVTLVNPSSGAYEIVWVTAHTAGATTATILRAQEGSTAAAWASGATWTHGPTAGDVGAPIALLEAGAATPASLLPGTLVIEKGRSPAGAILADAPVAYYKLDETTGTFTDYSGFGRHLTPGSGVVRGVAPVNIVDGGYSASTSGTAEVGIWTPGTDIAGLSGTGPMTMECRVRIPAGTVSYRGTFMSLSPGGWDIGIGANSRSDQMGNNLNFGYHTINWYATGFIFTPGDFHIMAVKPTPLVTAVYVNGQLVYNNSVGTVPNTASPTTLGVGRAASDSTSSLSAGIALDDVAFYDKALTSAQAVTHWGASQTGTKFRGWWNGTAMQPLLNV